MPMVSARKRCVRSGNRLMTLVSVWKRQQVEVMVLDISEACRRFSLSMKQCQPNPWHAFKERHAIGSRVSGTVTNVAEFGVFLGLEGGIDALVHLSSIPWNEEGERALRAYCEGNKIEKAAARELLKKLASRMYRVGQAVEAVLLDIDPERERARLGIKELGGDV